MTRAKAAPDEPGRTKRNPGDPDTKARNRKPDERPREQPADDSIEGEGSPGLTITGGGGHA